VGQAEAAHGGDHQSLTERMTWTPNLGGQATTIEMAAAIIGAL
jgi:hypothetical protein